MDNFQISFYEIYSNSALESKPVTDSVLRRVKSMDFLPQPNMTLLPLDKEKMVRKSVMYSLHGSVILESVNWFTIK